MHKFRLKEEHQKGRNSDLWPYEALRSEWEMHLEDFPTFQSYLDLFDKVENIDMGHYDEFHEKKAQEAAQRNVFKQEDADENSFLASESYKNEWEDWCDGLHSWTKDLPLEYDSVNSPRHYRKHPSGVECIQITEYMNFCLGNAIKYIWRAGIKSENPIEDLKKAVWYINREINRIGGV